MLISNFGYKHIVNFTSKQNGSFKNIRRNNELNIKTDDAFDRNKSIYL
ncbi:hypothetical protein LEP1GSC050_2073 [Leptospira broomii serovar Hurstbridge str. 5399]|uniref:Uncharacterized protein n=1 Tax=Leptospira broomii serovar Hurstbridge str. 5399 TaxID=1049789 RepID=T0FBG9_9LEPT|nr:hypothetical protein LEP1GSC050_2073 [Leptospira broomii serovar Hurstbridge str. 5399]